MGGEIWSWETLSGWLFKDSNMTEKVFISKLRTMRNHLQERLYKCENQDLRDKITRKLEMYNIMLQEFGYPAYVDKKKQNRRI